MNRSARFALAGLETGVTGALAMIAWLAVASVWSRRGIWWIPNLFAGVFHGGGALRFSFTRYTAAGIALDVFVYGSIGCVFGLAWREQRGGARLLWTGLLVGLAAWYLLFRVLLKALNPETSLYLPDRPLAIGNAVYGLMLTRFPRRAALLEPGSRAKLDDEAHPAG